MTRRVARPGQRWYELVRRRRATAALAARLLVRIVARQECERVPVAGGGQRAAAGLLHFELQNALLAACEHKAVVLEDVHLAHGTRAVLQ